MKTYQSRREYISSIFWAAAGLKAIGVGEGSPDTIEPGEAPQPQAKNGASPDEGSDPARVAIALGPKPARPAARLARIAGGMQRAAAKRASPGARRVGQIGIAGEQQLMQCGVG